MAYEQELQVAIAAVSDAAVLCERVRQQRGGEAMQKQDQSPVTIADFGAQAIICRALALAFPQDAIVAEESATLLKQPEMRDQLEQVTTYVQQVVPDATPETVLTWIDHGKGTIPSRYWTLDPIDGTKGFVRGDQYAIALALIDNGRVQVGVMGCPSLSVALSETHHTQTGVLFAAVRGQGTQVIELASHQAHPVRVTQASDTARLTESVERDHGNPSLQRTVATSVGLTTPPLAMDSQAKYGVVACGMAALYLRLSWVQEPDYRENIWDHAAGAIVVEEAGGQVTDAFGKPLDFSCGSKLSNNRGIIASNGLVHAAVLQVLSQSSGLTAR